MKLLKAFGQALLIYTLVTVVILVLLIACMLVDSYGTPALAGLISLFGLGALTSVIYHFGGPFGPN